MRVKYFSFYVGLFILSACGDGSSSLTKAEISALRGNKFTMEVDRAVLSPDVLFPSDELSEEDYAASNGGKKYTVTFSESSDGVLVEPGPIKGRLTKNMGSGIRNYYNLSPTKRAFGGGRFIVWSENGKFEGELTIYGSGDPIILSERGYLRPN